MKAKKTYWLLESKQRISTDDSYDIFQQPRTYIVQVHSFILIEGVTTSLGVFFFSSIEIKLFLEMYLSYFSRLFNI